MLKANIDLISKNERLSLSNYRFFFDFDNTLVEFDVFDELIKRFAINGDWAVFEDAWREGKIGSGECLEGQLRSARITKPVLLKYLSQIKLDPYFSKLLAMLRQEAIEPVILSDSFSFMIEYILRNNGIKGVKVYANKMRFYKDRIIPSFPYRNKFCAKCANCKKNHLRRNSQASQIKVYIGDGLSDICPAQEADLVFAKDSLLGHFEKIKKPCLNFKSLSDVHSYFKEIKHGSEAEGQ